jgi:hypothetical protein
MNAAIANEPARPEFRSKRFTLQLLQADVTGDR